MSRYTIQKGDGPMVPYVSVTQITGQLEKPALVAWAAEMSIEHVRKHSTLAGDFYSVPVSVLDEAATACERKSDEALSTGSQVHAMIEAHIRHAHDMSTEGTYSDEAQNAFLAFLEWEKKSKVEWLEYERPVVDVTHGYAGTLDAVARVDDRLTVVDFKTSGGIWDEYWYQVAAYRQARATMHGTYRVDGPAGVIEYCYNQMTEIDGVGILRLSKKDGMPEWKAVYDRERIARFTLAFNALVDFYWLAKSRRGMAGNAGMKSADDAIDWEANTEPCIFPGEEDDQ